MRNHNKELNNEPEEKQEEQKEDAREQEYKVLRVPVCISVEEMFNIINQKLDALLNANNK